MAKSLYICYFGVREPLVQTQVIPYLRELIKGGVKITLLTFEPAAGDGENGKKGDEEIRKELAREGIDWHWLRYHKRLSAAATVYDVMAGALYINNLQRRNKFDVFHIRAHIPGPMAVLARRLSRQKPKLLFDIRGFIPEEYTDAGIWPQDGFLYRLIKRVEKWLLREADGFVVLTEKAKEILFGNAETDNPQSKFHNPKSERRPIEVIPCCVDLKRFKSANDQTRAEMRKKLGIEVRFVAAYVGAFGGWYLTEATADFFGMLKQARPDAFALILTQSKREMIEPLLQARGYADGDYLITQVRPDEIPAYLSAADAAVSFIKRCYSKQASSPTKNAEYLACGLPIIANAGVGDVDKLINENNVGALVESFDPESYKTALNKIAVLGNIGDRCREVARREFDLEKVGGERYRQIYRRLLDKD